MGYPCFEVEVSRHGDPSRRRPWDVTFGIRASLFAPSTPSPEELLSAAAESGDAGSVAEHLAAGADPTHLDASGLTPLMHAVVGGHAAAIRLLLDVGAPCIALSAFDRSIDPHTSLKTEADRERDLELELFRSGSAPPTVEGSMGALHRAGADVFLEDDLRADPAYHSYYSNGNINPRLPPPLFSKEAAAAQPETDEAALDKPDLGPFILKQARDAKVSGEGGGAGRALELAERTARALERRGEGAELELAMSLHVAAAIHCGLGRHADAIPVLERAVAVVTPPEGEGSEDQQPEENKGEEWALAVFSGWMQLGDTHAMLGRMDESIACYGKGLEIQMGALGERDLRIAFDAVSITLDATPPGLPDNDGGAVVVLVDVAEAGGRIAGDLGVFANTEARSFSVEGSLNLKNLFGYCETWDASGVLGLDQTMELSAGVAIPRIGPNVKDSLSWLDYIDGANEKIMHKEKPDEKPIENPDGKQNEQPDGSIPISSAEPKQEETTSPVDGSSADPEEDHVESAAVVIQSGIRTYIARQELSNHKDLVKLQAVIRGHLVRRQAVESLQCLLAIVKMQGLVRAHQTQQSAGKFKDTLVRSSSESLLHNGFALKLMDNMSTSKSVHIKCDPSESDVTWKWMERWTALIPPITGGHSLENKESSGLVVEMVEEDAQHEEKTTPLDSDISFPKLVPHDLEEMLRQSDSSALDAPPCVPDKTSGVEIKDDPEPEFIEKINEDAEKLIDPKTKNVVEQSLELSGEQSTQTDPSNEPSALPKKPESSNEDIMDAYKTEQTLDMEGKRFVTRKSCNPAFAAAQLKFEELSSNSTVSRSNSSSYLDGASISKVHTPHSQDNVSSKHDNGTSIPESSDGHDSKIILAASECGTEISISSTLDSPDRSEADGGEIVLEIGALEDRNYVTINADKDTHVLHSEVNNTSGVMQPEQEEEQNGDVANPVVATDPVLVEQPLGLEKPDLHEQPEKSVESYAKSPEGTPMSRTTFAESHGTPSSEVSVNTKKSKSKKPKSRVSRRSLTSPSSDSVGRSSTDNLPKDYKHAKRESSVKVVKSDHVDQEPRMSNSTPLPSYMQFTESARAKASASVSPKLSPDVQDNNPRKRDSFPMTNSKQDSSPRMQRSSSQAQQNVKSNSAVPHNSSDRRWHI